MVLLAHTGMRWAEADAAILLAGGTTVAVYPTAGSELLEAIVCDAEPDVILSEDHAPVVGSNSPCLCVGLAEHGALTFDALVEEGGRLLAEQGTTARRLEERGRAVRPQDVATVAYTAGFDGDPKGVLLTHENLAAQARALEAVLPLDENDQQLLFLPLAHVLARVTLLLQLRVGFCTAFATDPDSVLADCRRLGPTVLLAVPRFYDEVRRDLRKTGHRGPLVDRLWQWAQGTGTELARAQNQRRRVGSLLRVRRRYADRVLFSVLRERLGGRMRLLLSGAAPLPGETADLFRAAGLSVLEGYGLTETSGPATLNLPGAERPHTVGRPLPGIDIRVGADEEVQVRGQAVSPGYHRDLQATRTAFDGEWLRTGDRGHLDVDGYLTILGRRRAPMTTSNGDTLDPGPLELALEESPLIAHAVVVGEGRPHLGVLCALDLGALGPWARKRGLSADPQSLVTHPTVRGAIAEEIVQVNRDRSQAESIRAFEILDDGLSEARGEISPMGHVRRSAVARQRGALIDALFDRGSELSDFG